MAWSYTALTDRSVAKFAEIISDNGFVFINGNASSSKTLNIVASGFTPTSYKWYKKNSNGTYDEIQGATSATYVVQGVTNIGTYKGSAFDGNEELSDYVTIDAVSDGTSGSSPYLFSLSNENFTINTTNDLKPTTSLNYEVKVTGYHGSSVMTPIASGTPTAEQFKITIPSGSIFSLKSGTSDTLVYAANTSTALSNENLAETITITYDTNKSETKTITVSCAKNGISPEITQNKVGDTTTVTIKDAAGTKTATIKDGSKGDSITISSTEVKYQASTSNTTVPTDTWNTTIPSVAAGSYLWTRTVITYSDNTSVTSYSVARQGINGADSTVAGPRAIRYLGKSSTVGSGVTNKNPTDLGTTIDGDWFLNTNDGYVYYRTGNTAWSKLTCTSGVPDYRIVAAIEDLIVLSTTITTNTTLNYVVDKYVECIVTGTAFINKLFAKQITLQTGGVIQSSDYSAHTSSSIGSGFKINANGTAEFNGSSLSINGQKIIYDNKGNFIIGSSYFSDTGSVGSGNLCIGENAGLKQTSGAMFNIAIGTGALQNKTSKSNNTAIGTVSMQNAIEPVACTAVGASSLQYTTTGTFNSALGSSAGKSCSSGEHNIFLGTYSGNDCTTGSHNVFIHSETGSSNHNNISTGSFNVIIGSPKMNQVTDTSNLTYINNAIKHQNGILYANTNTTASDSPTWKQVLTVGDTVSEAITAYSGVWGRLGGANQASSANWTDLIAEITGYSSGGGICGGSIFTSAADKGIPAGWYNFLYIPHRNGTGGDNYLYGTLFVIPMTSNTDHFYIIHHISGTVYDAIKISQTPNKASTAETANKIRIGNSSPENGDIWIE